MGVSIKKPRGMLDIMPQAIGDIPGIDHWQYLENKLHELASCYGYSEARFSFLEHVNLFKRSIGDVTDIVSKEMYIFPGSDELALRPEGTASCVRACLEYGLIGRGALQKLWYLSPMFRRERPQKGRYRQFYQFGVESFGSSSIEAEAEQIAMLWRLWKLLDLTDDIKLEINSLGSAACRESYSKELQSYLLSLGNKLPEDVIERAKRNPLRVLDSKDPAVIDLLADAPMIDNFLSTEDAKHFDNLRSVLQELSIPYVINRKMVRGLDYYNQTVYEWVTDMLGSQSAVAAGGRYDSLVKTLGGDDTPAVGFAMGLERVLLMLQKKDKIQSNSPDGFLIVDNIGVSQTVIAEKIRDLCPWIKLSASASEGSFKSQFKKADKSGATVALIVGDAEFSKESISIKFLREDREQIMVPMNDIAKFLGEQLL